MKQILFELYFEELDSHFNQRIPYITKSLRSLVVNAVLMRV
jgi:hypothetical protein